MTNQEIALKSAEDAFKSTILKIFEVLSTELLTVDNPDQKLALIEKAKKGVKLAKKEYIIFKEITRMLLVYRHEAVLNLNE